MMRLFSLLYIATSHMVHVHYFSWVLLVVIYIYKCQKVCMKRGHSRSETKYEIK